MANISAQASAKYTLVAQDITNGWAKVHVNWPSPFFDTNYTPTFSVEDLDSVVDLSFVVGDIHNLAPDGLDAIVYMQGSLPLIQGQVDLVNSTNTLAPITRTAPLTTMYQVTLYYGPARTSALDEGISWSPTVTWTDPTGNNLTASITSPTITLGPAVGGNTDSHGVNYLQDFNLPLFVKGGTTVSVTGAYSGSGPGGTTMPMNISIRLVQMPNNATTPLVGDQFVIHAMASHR